MSEMFKAEREILYRAISRGVTWGNNVTVARLEAVESVLAAGFKRVEDEDIELLKRCHAFIDNNSFPDQSDLADRLCGLIARLEVKG